MMKAISLWQPWATLIILGAKRIETRSWCPPRALLNQRVAVHAAKRIDPCVLAPPFSDWISDPVRECPTGALLGTIMIHSAWQIGRILDGDELIARNGSADERAFGDYTPGRYAWLLSDPIMLSVPIPCKGHQRFFEVPYL